MMKLLCIAGMFGMASAFSLDATEIGTQDTTHDEMFKAIEYAVIQKSHVTRRLGITHIVPGAETIQNALAAASPGDELVLGDGTYQLSSTITIDNLSVTSNLSVMTNLSLGGVALLGS